MASKSKKTTKPKKPGKPKAASKSKAAGKPKAAAKPKAEKKPKPDTLSSKNVTKTLNVMAALKSAKGVTIDELTEMTGWLPHTARAYLSGVRKKLREKNDGTQIVKYTRDGKTMYKLETDADAGKQ